MLWYNYVYKPFWKPLVDPDKPSPAPDVKIQAVPTRVPILPKSTPQAIVGDNSFKDLLDKPAKAAPSINPKLPEKERISKPIALPPPPLPSISLDVPPTPSVTNTIDDNSAESPSSTGVKAPEITVESVITSFPTVVASETASATFPSDPSDTNDHPNMVPIPPLNNKNMGTKSSKYPTNSTPSNLVSSNSLNNESVNTSKLSGTMIGIITFTTFLIAVVGLLLCYKRRKKSKSSTLPTHDLKAVPPVPYTTFSYHSEGSLEDLYTAPLASTGAFYSTMQSNKIEEGTTYDLQHPILSQNRGGSIFRSSIASYSQFTESSVYDSSIGPNSHFEAEFKTPNTYTVVDDLGTPYPSGVTSISGSMYTNNNERNQMEITPVRSLNDSTYTYEKCSLHYEDDHNVSKVSKM